MSASPSIWSSVCPKPPLPAARTGLAAQRAQCGPFRSRPNRTLIAKPRCAADLGLGCRKHHAGVVLGRGDDPRHHRLFGDRPRRRRDRIAQMNPAAPATIPACVMESSAFRSWCCSTLAAPCRDGILFRASSSRPRASWSCGLLEYRGALMTIPGLRGPPRSVFRPAIWYLRAPPSRCARARRRS